VNWKSAEKGPIARLAGAEVARDQTSGMNSSARAARLGRAISQMTVGKNVIRTSNDLSA